MDAGRLRVGLVGTYPPRACGLATFTADVASSLRDAGNLVDVVALCDGPTDVTDGDVAHRLDRHDPLAYVEVAAALSRTVDVVLVQHEFGIFGGRDGDMLAELTERLDVPYALTLHTVVGSFTTDQRAALARPLRRAAAVIVFTDEAVRLVDRQFSDVVDRCRVVPHGAPPELYASRAVDTRARLGVPDDSTVITTFGLLSPGKGIDRAITAVASLRHAVDDLVYIVAGQTHPEVVRRDGERYRRQLERLVEDRGLGEVVMFRNWFHDVDELARLLAATDIFVTPYADAEQIVSGALSFAVAAGVPFVSTSYRYATELAAKGCGVTVPFEAPDRLASTLKEVLSDELAMTRMRRCARDVGAGMSWTAVARRITTVMHDIAG